MYVYKPYELVSIMSRDCPDRFQSRNCSEKQLFWDVWHHALRARFHHSRYCPDRFRKCPLLTKLPIFRTKPALLAEYIVLNNETIEISQTMTDNPLINIWIKLWELKSKRIKMHVECLTIWINLALSVLPSYAQRLHMLEMPAKPNPLFLALLNSFR